MCLGIPAKIVKIVNSTADVEIGGIRKKASLELVEDVKVGDYILLHAGFAIQKVSEEDALETLKLLRKIAKDEVF
jgi:hydrogenase expression/formation protein HypC